MTETSIFTCQCGNTANRPKGCTIPEGWSILKVRGRDKLFCADCLPPTNSPCAAMANRPKMVREQDSASDATSILLRTGAMIDLANPDCTIVTIHDIASGLARNCRFAGQACNVRSYYSVAEHSVIASKIAPTRHAYAALMHDAAEGLIGDVTKPLKNMLPEYRKIEQRLENRLFARFMVNMDKPAIKRIDAQMLEAEKRALIPNRSRSEIVEEKVVSAESMVTGWLPDEAERRFLERFYEIAPEQLLGIVAKVAA